MRPNCANFRGVMFRKISPLMLPVAIIVATWLLLPRIPLIPPGKMELLISAPYLLFAVGMGLSFHFRRGRVFMILALIALCYCLFIFRLAGAEGPDTPDAWLLYRAIAVLLPFNLLLCSLMREKGVLTKAGRMRMLFFAIQVLILWVTVSNNHQGFWVFLTHKLVTWPVLDRFPVSQESLLLFLAA